MTKKKILLVVEDDAVDAMVIKRALKELGVTNDLHWVKNGREGLQMLKDKGNEFCLILLDLNMPVMNGFEFLEEKHKESLHKEIPTIILTTSNTEQDREKGINLGASGYLVKPLGYEAFKQVLSEIDYTKCKG